MSKLIFTKTSTQVPAPDAGQVSMYVRTDGNVVLKDESGEEKILRSGTDIQVPVPLAQGGTGVTSQQGAINSLTNAPAAVTGHVLTRNGQGNAVWAAPTGGNVTYPLAINQGGTGQATAQAAISALTGAALAVPGQVLTIENDGSVAWAEPGIPSVVPIAQGGTGETTADEAIAALTGSSAATAGQVLTKAQDGTLEWTDVVSPTDVIAIAQGGTGQTTRQAALNALANAAGGVEGQVLLKVGTDVVWGSAGGGSGPTANLPDPTGQAANQVVVTSANASYILTDASSVFTAAGGLTANIVNAKGDLIAGTADNTVSRLGVGANGKVLAANSTTATGLEWVDRTTLTGSTVNAIPKLTGANAMAASGVTIGSTNLLTVPGGISSGSNVTVTGNMSASGTVTSTGVLTASAGVAVTGNITVTGNVDGRDVSVDGARLDTLRADFKKSMTDQTAPTVNDDANDGYAQGSIWNQIGNFGTPTIIGGVRQFVCSDPTPGAAVWTPVNGTKLNSITPSASAVLPVVAPTNASPDFRQGVLYSRAIKGGSNIVVSLANEGAAEYEKSIQISTVDAVMTTDELPATLNTATTATGTTLVPASAAAALNLGTNSAGYSGVFVGDNGVAQVAIDKAKPLGINTAMTDAGSNPYAAYNRMKGARGLMVGDNPVPVFTYVTKTPFIGSLPSGTGLRYTPVLHDFGADAALPFQTGFLEVDVQLRLGMNPKNSVSNSVPQFRWYLAISETDTQGPVLSQSNGVVVNGPNGFIAASGIVYAPVEYNNTGSIIPPDPEAFQVDIRLGIDLFYDTATSRWISHPRGNATISNRADTASGFAAALGPFGASKVCPLSQLEYVLKTGSISSTFGFGSNERPRLALWFSQSGTDGEDKWGSTYYGYAAGGVNVGSGHVAVKFTPRFGPRDGAITTDQYRKSDGFFTTY